MSGGCGCIERIHHGQSGCLLLLLLLVMAVVVVVVEVDGAAGRGAGGGRGSGRSVGTQMSIVCLVVGRRCG